MAKSDIDTLSEYYEYELSHLRSAGSEFACKFPKIARRLDLSGSESSDPHVERLIESFAFLTGKLQKQIDDQFPATASALLDVLCQPLMLPTPSCVIVNFDIDIPRASKSPGFLIPRNTQLHTTSNSGEVCSFSTAHDLQLWPIEITKVAAVQKEHIPSYYARSTFYLKISVKYNGSAGSQTPEKLRFYINANALLRGKIFSSIFMSEENVLFHKNEQFKFIPPISAIGLEDNESLFPYPTNVHKGFRLLHEYFSFGEKFLGFDVHISKSVDINGESTIYIPMQYDVSMQLSVKNFSISSVPAVNLFRKISEPLRLEHKQVEYCLVSDFRRYRNHEIYNIEKIIAVDAEKNDEIVVPEFFSCDHGIIPFKEKIFWTARRKKSYIANALGDDIHISFIDMDFNPHFPADKVFYAHTLCTNRHIAEQIPASGTLKTEISTPTKNIFCVERPTSQKTSIKTGEILWKFVSALSLNSISFNSDGIKKIKEIVGIFADISISSLRGEIDAMIDVKCKTKTKRVCNQTWQGFAVGSSIEITFDDSISNFGIPLSLVISKFLTSYTSINTFTEVIVKSTTKNGILKKWEQHFGIQNYL